MGCMNWKNIVMALLSVILLTIAVASAQTISIGTLQMNKDETKTIDVILDIVPSTGLSYANVSVTIANASVAEIVDIQYPGWATLTDNSTLPSSTVWFKVGDLSNQVKAGDTNVVLATLKIKGLNPGTSDIKITVNSFQDDNYQNIEDQIATISGNVNTISPSILTFHLLLTNDTYCAMWSNINRYDLEADKPIGEIEQKISELDFNSYLYGDILTKVDIASMATSLEVRSPFMDHRVIEFTSLIPDDLKYKNKTGKYILKKLLQRYIPKEFFDRPKMGFGVPIGEWFRGKLKDLLLDYLSDDRLRHEGIFNIRYINRIINEHLFKNVNHQYRLWTLLMWEMWREKWL